MPTEKTESSVNVAEMAFEKAMQELERIVGELEKGSVSLDESVRLYALGKALQERCEKLLADAEANGIGPEFRKLTDAAERHGLYLRPWKRSLMITPQANRSRMLYTLETRPTRAGELRGWLAPEAFAEFFPPLTEEEVTRELGQSRRLMLSANGVDRLAEGLDRLFARILSSVERSEEDRGEDGGEHAA